MLSGILKRNCQDTQLSLSDNYDEAGLQVGEKAIDFRLTDINSTEFQLSQLLVEKPVVMVFGSFT
jgi:cytochrome oxidase Cu insertion factor (SCO1/SenC/PrrC family)